MTEDDRIRVPRTTLSVDAKLNRAALSQLVSRMLLAMHAQSDSEEQQSNGEENSNGNSQAM